MRRVELFLSLGVLITVCGCEPDDAQGIAGIGRPNRGDAGDSDAGMLLDPEPTLYAVVSSDYAAASVALLDAEGEVLDRDFINSGSAPSGLVTAFSGDITLPTRSGDPEILTILDRFRTDVVTRIDPYSGEVLGQINTHTPGDAHDETAYSSNPQDYVYFGEHDAWITRFQPNVNVREGDPDQGLDLLHIDPSTFERGRRISLWHLNSKAERTDPRTKATETVTVYARPSAMVRVGDRLVVGIASLSLAFDAIGDGMVALVDPEAGSADGFELAGLQNCGSVDPVAGDPTRVVVACEGFFRGVQRDTAGLVILKLEAGELAIEHLWRAEDDEDAPLTVSSVVPIGGTEVVAAAIGRSSSRSDDGEVIPATNDALYVVDLATGEQTKLFEADGQYRIGSGAYNARKGLLFIPDASTDGKGRPSAGVRTFERQDDGSFEAREVIRLDDILPARQVAAL